MLIPLYKASSRLSGFAFKESMREWSERAMLSLKACQLSVSLKPVKKSSI